MITTEDTYDVTNKVLEIPVDSIRQAADNPRSDLGDLEGLAASIREIGVLQAITVVPDAGSDTFTVMMGARRHAAAQLAGMLTIPAVVLAKPEDLHRAKAMLIENVQRSDLTPIDEARAFDQLEQKFDLSQADIAAAVGCSQAHVSKRLSLLALPMKARKMLTDGELTISTALELAKLADHPDRIKKILARTVNQRELDWQIERELTDVAIEQAIADARAKLDAAGTKVIDRKQSERLTRLADPDAYVWSGTFIRVAKPDVKKHAKEPCHAVYIEETTRRGKPELIPYCTQPARHDPKKGDSAIKALKAKKSDAGNGKTAKQVERERAEREAAKHRRAFMAEIVRDHKPNRDEILDIVQSRYLWDAAHDELGKMVDLLGLEKPPKRTNGGPDYRGTIDTYAAESPTNRLRACLAFALVQGEWGYGHTDSLHKILHAHGYEPTPLEVEQRGQLAEEKSHDDANDARDRALERAEELDDGPEGILERISELTCELDEGCSPPRAREIQAEFDAMFVELNNIQPGDIVDHDGEGHTIERASHSAAPDELEAHAAPAPPDDTHASDGVNGHPVITAEGAAASNLDDYQKPPKDCSNAEAWARQQIDTALAEQPDSAELLAIRQELFAGVDEERAIEIRARLHALMQLDDYLHATSGPVERQCRDLIAKLPADNERVAELQQQLYRGVQVSTAATIRRELKDLKSKLAVAKK